MRPGEGVITISSVARNSASSTLCVMKKNILPRLPPQLEDQLLDLLARERVERAERLVHQHHFRVAGERARDADALLHAAGELVDGRVGELLEADERAACRARSRGARRAATPRMRRPNSTLSTTLSHGISACFWNTTPRSAPGPVTGLPSSRISPVGRRQEAGDARQQRRLAAARGAERDDEIAGIERQVDVGERERLRVRRDRRS